MSEQKWISVGERLPELCKYQPGFGHHSEMVLCFLFGLQAIGEYSRRDTGPHKGKEGWDFVSGEIKRRPDRRVTHWMPLPDPPQH